MGEEPLGAVVIGTGFGVLTHVRALRAAGIEVRALVGRDPEKTADRAARASVPMALTTLAQALALPEAQIVAVATPPHTHADIVLQAIDAGKHVVCEKPFARNAEEAGKMLRAAESAGIIHLLGTEFRWSTGQALLARAIGEGVIGQPRLATFIMNVPVLANPRGEVPAWWSRAEDGGGWLGAYCSHIIDQIRVTLGEFSGVSASLSLVSDRDWTAEDTYTVHFRTQRGVDGMLQSTAGGWGPGVICSRVYGSKGSAWIEGDGVRVADAEGTRMLDVPTDLLNPPPQGPAAGRHPEALGGRSQALRARGASSGVRVARGSGGAHRRARSRRVRRRHPGSAERGAWQSLLHARGRLSADPRQARPRGRARHAAHLRRAHERHGLRERRAPRGTRRRQRRSAGRRADRRPHSPERVGAKAGSPGVARSARAPSAQRFEPPARGYARLHREQVLQADQGCDLDFLRCAPTRP